MSTDPTPDGEFAALFDRFQAEVARKVEETLASGPTAATLDWLATIPWVTDEIARAASSNPNPAVSLPDLVKEGWLSERPSQPPRYEMPATARESWRVRYAKAHGAGAVLAAVARSAAALAAAPSLPDELGRWSALVADAAGPGECAARLRERLEAACPALRDIAPTEQSAADRELAEANLWVEAGQRLADMLDQAPELALELRRATCRLHRNLRRAECADLTARFLDRPFLTGEAVRLLDASIPTWALHFLGVGGAGKTVHLRNLEARVVPREVPVARVDFDDLDPAFPTRDPGLLLDAVIGTFRLWDETDRGASLASTFHLQRILVQKELPEDGWDPAAPEMPPALDRLIGLFAEMLSLAAHDVALLILDTCEELARVSPEGEAPRNVLGTFVLLEAIHQRFPGLRVLFCGRRPLAREYANATLPAAPAGLAPRPYLQLAVVKGFDRAEAGGLFDLLESARGARKIEPTLREAVLQQCPALQHTMVPTAPEAPRYNPFDISFLGRLVAMDAEADAAKLAAAPDAYIRDRIVKRFDTRSDGRPLRPEDALVRRSLPLLAALGTLDAATLAAAMPGVPARSVIEELGRQEWASFDGDRVRVHEAFRERIARFFPAASDETRALVVSSLAHLEAATTSPDAPLDQKLIDLCEALAANLAKEPRRFQAWWARVEALATRSEAGLTWVSSLCGRLLARLGDESAGDAFHPCRAAVLATRIADALRWSPENDRRPSWREVARLIAPWQDDLCLRAAAGRVAASVDIEAAPDPADLAMLAACWPESLDPSRTQAWGALTAAAEALVEGAEAAGAPLVPEWSERLKATSRRAASLPDGRHLGAFWDVLVGRMSSLEGRSGEAEEALGRACGSTVLNQRAEDCWLDWRAPRALGAWVRAERLRVLSPHLSLRSLVSDEGLAPSLPGGESTSVDEDRYRSLWWELRRRAEVTAAPSPAPWPASDRPRRRALHTEVPPWFVVSALLAADRGELDAALHQLRNESFGLESVGATVVRADERHSRIALADLALRFRWVEDGVVSISRLVGSGAQAGSTIDEDAVATLRAFHDDALRGPGGPLQRRDAYAGTPHAVWRALPAGSSEQAVALLAYASTVIVPLVEGGEDRSRDDLALDLREAALIAERFRLPPPPEPRPVVASEPSHADRIWLRRLGLGPDDEAAKRRRLDRYAEAVGPRHAAELVFEEGALLALRLPLLATPLLIWTREVFVQAGDTLGAFRAGCAAAMARLYAGKVLAHSEKLDLARWALATLPKDPLVIELEQALAAGRPARVNLPTPADECWAAWKRRLGLVVQWNESSLRPEDRAEGPSGAAVGADLALLLQVIASHAPAGVATDLNPRVASLNGESLSVGTMFPASSQRMRPIDRDATTGDASAWFQALAIQSRSDVTRVSSDRSRVENLAVDVRLPQGARSEWTVEGITRRSYREQRDSLNERLRRAPPGDPRPRCLEVDAVTAMVAWEAILREDGSPPSFRSIPSGRRTLPSLRSSPVVGVITPNVRFGVQILQSWQHVAADDVLRPSDVFARRGSLPGRGQAITLAHLIADPTWTSGGPRLVMAEKEQFVGPEELVRAMPALWLCVLQQDSSTGVRRSPNVRHASRLLRCFGADLAALGVPVVMLVPALPTELALEVAGLLSSSARDPHDLLAILAAVESAREAIRRFPGAGDEDRDELAGDLALHLRPDVFPP